MNNKIKNRDVLWMSKCGNIAVTYDSEDMGDKYHIYHKAIYVPENIENWEILITFPTLGEAVGYAEKIYDEPWMR